MKRFYQSATVGKTDGAWTVLLDGKPVRTPAKASLELPTPKLAAAIAEEWAKQGEQVKPASMPLMRLACTAIDRVRSERAAVIEELAGYAKSDLLCYRAEGPRDLVERQARLWQPWLDWAAKRHGACLKITRGIQPIEQAPEALSALKAAIAAQGAFELTAIHALVTGYGSVVLGLAAFEAAVPPEAAWEAARCDEAYQEERWGIDAEAAHRSRHLKADIDAALAFVATLVT